MTDTQLKLRDAATQMKIAIKNVTNDDVFRSCINSFISNGRSVTFIMQKESSCHPLLDAWYKTKIDQLKKFPIMKFFNDKRVHSIHRGVVKPTYRTAPIFNLKIDDIPQLGSASISAWIFEDVANWIPGDSGNVLRLCEEYFLILKSLVHNWLIKRKELELYV